MSAHYTVEEHEGRIIDVLTDEIEGTRLMIARVGAEPISLAVRDKYDGWEGFFWRDGQFGKAASGWNNHATVMGYYVARIIGEKSVYDGQEVRGGTHSFLRHKTFQPPTADLGVKTLADFKLDPSDDDDWTLEAAAKREASLNGPASLTYTMTPAEFEPHEYPLKVSMKLTYTLEKKGVLRVGFRFENHEPERTAHVSFGLHPGFAASMDQHYLYMPQGVYRRLLAPGNFLSGETVAIQHPGGALAEIVNADLPNSYIFDLADVPERRFVLTDGVSGRRIVLNCAQVPYLTIWSDGHDFLCVEPCWGLPDHANQRPFEDKLGMMPIAPGGTLEREFAIEADITVNQDDAREGTGRA